MDQRINLYPEELQQISRQFTQASQNGQTVVQQLNKMILESEGQWEGERQREFLQRIQESLTSVRSYLSGLQETGTQLQQTAVRFQNADQCR
ncbi:WXG100 family type VII secretion target [Paenibacillus sp. PDC88]|uniref:WXG100 family type VII secretion target n=1 Tax=Paenibacillus sp. PDC88 TaxID=1884375 RepID=UPI00089747E9|nr:WXG100 family type VII secretion target [Paenibacillus sp. PDC88]SDX19152.1 WXG100 family type VII secretion target [Paenibacillus sp. PDC88]